MTFAPFTIVGTARSFPAQMAEIIARHEPLAVSSSVKGMDSRKQRRVCRECDGTGTVMSTTWDSPWREKIVECGSCGGSGEPA